MGKRYIESGYWQHGKQIWLLIGSEILQSWHRALFWFCYLWFSNFEGNRGFYSYFYDWKILNEDYSPKLWNEICFAPLLYGTSCDCFRWTALIGGILRIGPTRAKQFLRQWRRRGQNNPI